MEKAKVLEEPTNKNRKDCNRTVGLSKSTDAVKMSTEESKSVQITQDGKLLQMFWERPIFKGSDGPLL